MTSFKFVSRVGLEGEGVRRVRSIEVFGGLSEIDIVEDTLKVD
jgi:hypothetical protein